MIRLFASKIHRRAQTFFIIGYLLCSLSVALGEDSIDSGNLTISPTNPNKSWSPKRDLYPDESVSLTVNVTSSGTVNGKAFTMKDSPAAIFGGSATLWTQTGGGGTSFNFKALNTGLEPKTETVTVVAVWEEVPVPPSGKGGEGGEGAGRELQIIEGSASGTASSERPTFTWELDPRLQFADGQSQISFSVTAAAAGTTIKLQKYTIKNNQGWPLNMQSPSPPNKVNGIIKSDSPGKVILRIEINNIEQGRSENEVAFAKLDLAVERFEGGAVLSEDRLASGGTTSPPHELDPGTLVIAQANGDVNTGSRSKLTLKGDAGNPKEGTFTLRAENLPNIAVYPASNGGSAITLPHTWNATEFPADSTFYVGATSFTGSTNYQDGRLLLTYKRTLEAGGSEHKLEDTVGAKIATISLSSTKAAVDPAFSLTNPTFYPALGVNSWGNIYEQASVPACVIYYKDVINVDFEVQPFTVDLKFGPALQGATWSKVAGPTSGSLNGSGSNVAYKDPDKGGVYSFDVTVIEKTTITYLVLPLAGAEVKNLIQSDLLKADAFATTVVSTYNVLERNLPSNGNRWFVNAGAGDYLGRPDNTNSRTFWKLNQVSSNGMGAVATWFGYPTRVGKMSNFMVGYAARKIGVLSFSGWIAQIIGTSNDPSAIQSWNAGWDVGGGADYTTTVSALVKDIWNKADDKNKRLWPNPLALDNHVPRATHTDVDREFSSPGFLYMTSP